MAPVLKETIKFVVVILFFLGLVVAACFVVLPYTGVLDEARRGGIVRELVKGEAVPQAFLVGEGDDRIAVYRMKNEVAVVFLKVHLFLRDMDLALRIDRDRVVRMVDVTLGLPPFNPGLRSLFVAGSGGSGPVPGEILKNPGLDVVGGATVDYARLTLVLERVVGHVGKAGNK